MNSNARRRGAKVAPSYYPRVIFHSLRFAQLIAAVIVGGIMSYFMYYLHHESFPLPWQFIALLAISWATIATLTLTIILYNLTYLSPKFNCFLNSCISLAWMAGFGLLTWSLSNTLKKRCNIATWGSSTGVGVCLEYKGLWAFTLIGVVASLAALALDISTHRKSTSKGVYVLPEDDQKEAMLKGNGSMLQDLKSGKSQQGPVGYESRRGEPMETDVTYHNRYGSDENEEYETQAFKD